LVRGDGRETAGRMDGWLMDDRVYGDHYVTRANRPTERHSRHRTSACTQTVGRSVGRRTRQCRGSWDIDGIVRRAPIEQSFYLTEDNFTNWFLLAGDVASSRAMQCSIAAKQREGERERERAARKPASVMLVNVDFGLGLREPQDSAISFCRRLDLNACREWTVGRRPAGLVAATSTSFVSSWWSAR